LATGIEKSGGLCGLRLPNSTPELYVRASCQPVDGGGGGGAAAGGGEKLPETETENLSYAPDDEYGTRGLIDFARPRNKCSKALGNTLECSGLRVFCFFFLFKVARLSLTDFTSGNNMRGKLTF
jgi:hypothetical protein